MAVALLTAECSHAGAMASDLNPGDVPALAAAASFLASSVMHNPGGTAGDYADEERGCISKQRGDQGSPATNADKTTPLKKWSRRYKLDEQGISHHNARLEKPEGHSTGQRQEGKQEDRNIRENQRDEGWHYQDPGGDQGQRRDARLDYQRPERHDTERYQGLPVYPHRIRIRDKREHQQHRDADTRPHSDAALCLCDDWSLIPVGIGALGPLRMLCMPRDLCLEHPSTGSFITSRETPAAIRRKSLIISHAL